MADPNMYAAGHGSGAAIQQPVRWGYRGGGKYFPVGQGEQPPGYVTWDGQLEAAFRQIDLLMEQLYILE